MGLRGTDRKGGGKASIRGATFKLESPAADSYTSSLSSNFSS